MILGECGCSIFVLGEQAHLESMSSVVASAAIVLSGRTMALNLSSSHPDFRHLRVRIDSKDSAEVEVCGPGRSWEWPPLFSQPHVRK